MNTICKRVIALFLCFVLTAGILPVSAFADEGSEMAAAPATVSAEPTQADTENTDVPLDLTGTAALSNGATDLSEGDDADVPSEDDNTSIPPENNDTNTPSKGNDVNTPSEGNDVNTPSEGNDVNTPSEGNGVNTPSEGNDANTPSEGNDATEPSSEATEPSSEATEPSSEPTEPVVIPVTGIMLDQTALEVGVGELPMTLVATVLPEDATDKTVTWESSEPGVASVENGVLTFGYMGEAVITATAGEFSATCTVTVSEGESTAYADPDTIYVLAGGDFQAGDNGQEDHYYSRINMGNILDKIAETYSTMNGFLFVGDYDGDSHNDTNAATGITAMMEEVSKRYDTLNHDNSVLIEGNHETGNVSGIDRTGGYEFDGYAVYAINETDYCERQEGKSAQIQTVANNLETWLNNKLGEGYDAPIFVITHVPLAYGTRTYTNGDGLYAKYVFDVLNSAAEDGLNIIFLHGHDHAYGADNYLGGEAIYLPEGDKINICVPGDKTSWTEETLNFTYMNAGYVGYYNENYYNVNSYEAEKLTMTVFKIKGNQVTVERYSKDGLYNLKSAGREGFYSNASTCANIGLSYNTAVYASPQTISLSDVETGGTNGGSVEVTPDVEDDVTTSGNEWITITVPTGGTTTYTYTRVDSITEGNEYVIVANNDEYALDYTVPESIWSSSVSMTSDTVDISNDGTTMTSTSALTLWKFSNSSGSITISNGDYTLGYSSGSMGVGSNRSAYVQNGDSNNFVIKRRNNNNGYALYYNNNGNWSTSNSSTAQYVRLYQLTDTSTVGGTAGLYGMLDGTLTANVPYGTSSDDALAAVKNAVAIKYATAADYSDMQEYPDDGEGMTWTLDPNYDPNDPGDYAVTIAYNGVTLGTAEVVVNTTTKYYTAEGNGLYIVDMNTSEANALAAVKAGITVYSADDADGTNRQTIDDSKVTWNWVDTYNGADSGPYTVEILYNGTSLGTVEVKVDVQYETGIETDWTYIGETEATGGSYTYTLDTDGIDYGEENKYIIVDDNEAIVLNANSTSNGTAHGITINGNTATVDTRDYEYHMIQTTYNGTRYELITKGDGSQYLYQESNGVRYGTRSSVKFQVNHHGNGVYDIHDIDGTNWYIIYNSGWTVTETTSARVRLYKYTGTTGGTPGGPVYALIEGPTRYTVTQGSSATKALSAVKNGITGYTATDATGTGKTELADSDLTWKWKNTFNGNVTGSYWVEISYQGKVLGTVEVQVVPGVVNNYPEYPDEGAVKVNKTATGVDFQSSGIAQVEVSASGVPVKKGADVIVMLDTSSSMTSHTVTGTNKTRAAVLEESLQDLIAQFKAPGDDGEPLDIRVAIADFNGFYGDNHNSSGTPYDRDAADMMSDDISYNANSEAQVYTGTGDLSAGAFIPAEDLAASYTLNYTSGTNYDYAFDAIYQMGTSIKAANGSEDRDLYVIFMSDGAAMQWNYYHSQGASSLWNNWITGAWTENQLSLNCTTHDYYYDEVDHNGDGMRNEHRMANAVKGDPSETYEVIRKTDDLGTPTEETNMYMVPGLGAKIFSISFDAQTDTNVTEESMDKSIASLASEQTGTTQYYYKVTTAEELSDAFDAIGRDIAYAASNARFVDQMGDSFNLQMSTATYTVVDGETTTEKALTPKIEIISYDIWTRQDYLDGKCKESQIGDRKTDTDGNPVCTILETVTFTDDGQGNVTGAYSDLIGGNTNILADGTQEGYVKGVIYAKTFLYNTNTTEVAVDGVNIPTGKNSANLTTGSTNVLPKETFYWKMGTVQTSELAMRYYVYLDGSMEGTKQAGSYATNNFATIYYDNYLVNPCYKDTVSPSVAWKSANVSYAFYLVNENGEIIVNQTTGQTGSFANKIAVTNPVVYEEILLNNTDQVQALNVAAISDDVLPKYYELYDKDAVYTVTINSNSTGKWEITKGDAVTAESTYVTNFDTQIQYSNALTNETVGHDYTHTVVWFAVVWKLQAHPDSVVVDYGLPVDISVLGNDMFGENGRLAGVGAYSEGIENTTADTSMAAGFGSEYTGTYGKAEANTETGKVRYTLNTTEMPTYEKFAYAVNYTGSENAGYYYDTVTVIPATTIYYEDSFLDYSSYTWDYTTNAWVEKEASLWTTEGTVNTGATQDEDRPGKYALTDANNIYGYDSVNTGMSTYSLGSAMKATVDYDNKAHATFTFMGTGFDIISMTSNMTGMILIDVEKSENDAWTEFANYAVDTYYGYKQEAGDADGDGTVEDGEMIWVVDPDAQDSIYQVPVIKMVNKPYGQYRVTIKATYSPAFDHVANSQNYDFYLDAIRIYDPANDGNQDGDAVIEDAYKADGEGWPSYVELRNGLISEGTLGNAATDTKVEGLVFIDGDESVGDAQISDYISYGPNNEVYLAPGQRVAFRLDLPANVANVHIGIKSADGNIGTYTITNIAQKADTENNVAAGQWYNARTASMDTATDMYYDLTEWKDDIIVISNAGNREEHNTSGIISLTNIKFTYTSDPDGNEAGIFVTPKMAMLTLRSLNAPVEEEVPEETVPEETVPETTAPETTEPEETEPEETEPEETQPDKEAAKIQKEIEKALKKAAKEAEKAAKALQKAAEKAAKELSKLFGSWF